MINTNILCPECMSGQLLTEDNKEAHCQKCKTEFIIIAPMMVRYKKTAPTESNSDWYGRTQLDKHGIPKGAGNVSSYLGKWK